MTVLTAGMYGLITESLINPCALSRSFLNTGLKISGEYKRLGFQSGIHFQLQLVQQHLVFADFNEIGIVF